MKSRTKIEQGERRIGLARALSKLGYCSRSQAATLIHAGRVRLNGNIHHNPESPVRLQRDRIDVDNQPLQSWKRIYLMLNKPRGLVTTTSDEKGRATIYDLLKKDDPANQAPWLAPVGRLDKASEGLLLLTNDSEWGARIAAPKTHLAKTYHVQVSRIFSESDFDNMQEGIRTENGESLRVSHTRLLRSGEKNCWLEIVLDEGKNRHIRRMLEAMNVEVLRLVRVAIGPLQLGTLPKGQFRELTGGEKLALDACMQGKLHIPGKSQPRNGGR